VDYEAMTAGELQKECARRDLPSSRAAKAVMVQRLLDDDAARGGQSSEPYSEGGILVPALTETVNDSITPETVASPSAAPVHAFRKTFDAEQGGPDEEAHSACRQATIQAALDAGLRVRGDARLAEHGDGRWVYEVSVRRVT
jgi:hypothetical protein